MVQDKEVFFSNVVKIIDAFCVIIAFITAYFLSFPLRNTLGLGEFYYATAPNIQGLFYFTKKYSIIPLASIPIWLTALSFNGSYRDLRTRTFWKEFQIVLKSGVTATLLFGSLIFLFKMTLTSRLFIVVNSVMTVFVLAAARITWIHFFENIHKNEQNKINLLIVGTGKRARDFIRTVKMHSNWGLRIVGLIDDEHGMFGKAIEGFRVLGRLQDIPFILHRIVVDRVIFVVPRLWLNRIDEAILACEREGISTSISMDLYNLRIAKVRQTDFGGFPLLEFETFSAKQWQLFLKRTIDIFLSLILLILSFPIIIAAVTAIKVTSKGPILFTQVRSGLNGRKFKLYKFRTMIVGAEVKKRELEKANEMDGPVFKINKDPRITPVGRFLRKFSIDEIPQLFNVLRGDMSIVGPRPPLPVEVELYKMWQRRRLSLRPGLTCTWQVSGRNKIRFEKWMQMDLDYIDRWSLWLDFKILFRTVFVVLFGYGAS
ncbi:MAG: sugar transferase [bacterium]